MRPKPELYDSYYASWFKDPNVIAAYPSRPPQRMLRLSFSANSQPIVPRRVLHICCGAGDIARHLGPLADRVDAVHFSAGDDRRRPTTRGRRVGFIIGAHTELRDAPPQLEAVVAGSG